MNSRDAAANVPDALSATLRFPRFQLMHALARLESHGKGHFPMLQNSIGRNITLAAIAALALTCAAIVASAAPGRQDETCGNSGNSTRQLAIIDSASDDSFQCLSVSLDGDTVRAIRVETHRFTASEQRADSGQVEIAEYSVAVIESSHGAVLEGVPGHDALILQGHFATPATSAVLVTSYLYNGFTGEYRSCQMALDRGPDAGWRLRNGFAQTVSHIVIRTREIPWFGMFGIASLDGACTKREP